jgi:hypothetical protein
VLDETEMGNAALKLAADVPGPVGAAVVDEDDLVVSIQRPGDVGDVLDGALDVLLLIVRWQHNRKAHSCLLLLT